MKRVLIDHYSHNMQYPRRYDWLNDQQNTIVISTLLYFGIHGKKPKKKQKNRIFTKCKCNGYSRTTIIFIGFMQWYGYSHYQSNPFEEKEAIQSNIHTFDSVWITLDHAYGDCIQQS